jgi:diguanylate cyclase (GGDEF)-like protein
MRPVAAIYVTAVSAAGAWAIARALPSLDGGHPVVFAVLLGLSLLASVSKITIPVAGNDSSLTVCHVVDFMALMVCGTGPAVVVAAFGGWAQCTLRSAARNPAHRVVFSVATLALTMSCAGVVYEAFGGRPGLGLASPGFEPFIAAATVVFLMNSVLVAGAAALSTRRSIPLVWFESFLPAWPSYMIGAGIASGIAIVCERQAYWLLPLLAGPLVLLHRNFVSYLEHMRHSMTDPLTGLPNQRALMARLDQQIADSREPGRPFAVIFMDLDGLKALNDRGGHATGDAALVRVAECVKRMLRPNDLCARCGGDEFVVVLADCGGREAIVRREELKKAIGSIAIAIAPGIRVPLSASAGVSVFPDDGRSQEQLIAVADHRMYENKFQSARTSRLTA